MALVNFRDIGGIKLSNGKSIKKQILFRTGSLSFLGKNEAECLLKKTNVNCYIDFRNNLEIKERNLKGYISDKIRKLYRLNFDTEDDIFSSIYLPDSCDWADFYKRIFEKNLEKIIVFLEILFQECNKPIIFGCSAGKDRCGIMTAVLLSVLGVSNSEIIKDYCLSNQGLVDYYHFFNDSKKLLGRTRKEFIKHFLIVSEDTMMLFMHNIDADYGGFLRCLFNAGLDESIVKALKTQFIE
ncbi:MAG: tyrosine-protein phosphatase [Gammaproteobacteria bacterium]|nr:tyrosine-protein phosphatase [Gammaproteobacteria bacterium]